MKTRNSQPVTFVLSFSLTTYSGAYTTPTTKLCSAANGSYSTCENALSANDNHAYFTNNMTDSFNVPDPYHIHFSMTKWVPKVIRGQPQYKDYYIFDNNNNTTLMTNSDYNGTYLTDVSPSIWVRIKRQATIQKRTVLRRRTCTSRMTGLETVP